MELFKWWMEKGCVRERKRERRMEMTRESLRDVRLRTIGIKVDARKR